MIPTHQRNDSAARLITALFCLVLVLGLQSVSLAGPARKDGFNELFISSYILNREGDSAGATGTLRKTFGHANAGLIAPNAPNLDWGTINYWVNAMSTAAPSNGRGSTALIRDIVDLNYIEPQPGQFPLEADIVAVMSIYQAHGMNLILAFGVTSAAGHINEPAWITQRVQSAPVQNQMNTRIQIYADVISRFIQRLNNSYGNDGWRRWLQNNVSVEPINEFNVNVSGSTVYAATLDAKVQKTFTDNRTPLKVISSSIVSGTSQEYLNWFRDYYRNGAPASASPNIHLYYSPTLDNGQFMNSLQRFKTVVDALYHDVKPGAATKIVIGEVGQPMVDSANGTTHINLIKNLIDNPNLIDFQNEVSALAFWRFFATYIDLDCVKYVANCGADQASQTTFGFVHLPTKGYAGFPGTPLFIEPQLHLYYGL
jgi:hypothetical protein